MKVTWVVIFSLGYFAAVYTHPARREESEEVEFIPLGEQSGKPIVDTGVIGGGPWSSPFDDLFGGFAAMMARMRQQMDYLLRRLPFSRNGTIENGPFPGFPNIPEIDLSKGNTTSVTKVIDGHKVVINETSYNQEGDNGGAFFKVRIIDVQPDSSELTTEKNAESITHPPKEPESVEDSIENEIPKNKEPKDFSSVETFDQPDTSLHLRTVTNENMNEDNIETLESMEENSVKSVLPQRTSSWVPFEKLTTGNSKWNSIEPLESFEDNSIESVYRPPDLSRDIYVNQIMADAGAPVNPDAEVFSNVEFSVPFSTRSRQPFEKITNPR